MKKMSRKNYENIAQQLQSTFSRNLSYDDEVKLKNSLKVHAKNNYPPKYPKDRYFNFIKRNMGSFEIQELYPKSQNSPFVYSLFTTVTQKVYGNCLEECLDKAILMEKLEKSISKKEKEESND